MFDDGSLPPNSLVRTTPTASLLLLVSVEDDNTGAYTCTANNTNLGVINDDTTYLEVVGENKLSQILLHNFMHKFLIQHNFPEPRLRLLIDPDMVSLEEGMSGELICQVDCFCPGVTPEWSRPDNTPLPDNAMASHFNITW